MYKKGGKDTEIIQNLCPKEKYAVKCPYSMAPIGVCIHNTANDASAKSEIAYMLGNDNKVSFHYAVDDKEIIQAIPNDRNAWHAGDGGGGEGNRKYISVEICYSKSGGTRFEAAMKNAAALTARLLTDYGLNTENVKKHRDFSEKHCPHRILDDYGWDYFLNLVKGKFNMEEFKDVKGHYAEKEINELYQMGIVRGDPNGSFRPDEGATRAEAAIMVRNAVRYITGK